jgi:aspartyl protease family protein
MKVSRPWWGFLVFVAAVTSLIGYLAYRYPEVLAGTDGEIGVVHNLIWIGLIGASLFLHRRMPLGHALRYAAIWVAIGAFLVLAYGFRHEARFAWDRLVGELIPHQGVQSGAAVEIRAGSGGHFVVEASVDGKQVRFLVDTGATDVVLSPVDARRIGFDVGALKFTKTYRTANGIVAGAPVRLGRIAIGSIVVEDVRASVNGADMGRSLLGMSFLERLGGYEVTDGKLILRP